MWLTMCDDLLSPRLLNSFSELIKRIEPLTHGRAVIGQQFPCCLGEGTAGPWTVQGIEGSLQIGAAGHNAVKLPRRPGCGGRPVQIGKTSQQSVEIAPSDRLPPCTRLAVDKRKQRQAVTLIEAKGRFITMNGHGGYYELEVGPPTEDECCVVSTAQAIESRITVHSQPPLGIEIIGGHEVPLG